MSIAVTFRDETEEKRRENKHNNTLLSRCEAKPLPHLIQFGAPAFFNHESTLTDTNELGDREFCFRMMRTRDSPFL